MSATFHLLGRVDFDALLALQARLVYEAGEVGSGIKVLLAEHDELITIGRSGSRGHVRLTGKELARRGAPLRYVARGGGAILHAPGQLAIYPIVSLEQRGWTVDEYRRRLSAGLNAAVKSLGVAVQENCGVGVPPAQNTGETPMPQFTGGTPMPQRYGVYGRTGPIALVAAAVRRGVTSFGAYLNVNPAKSVFGYVDCDYATPVDLDSPRRRTQGSLLSECGRAARMPAVRAAVIEHLAAAFDSPRHYVVSGHPRLASRERVARVV